MRRQKRPADCDTNNQLLPVMDINITSLFAEKSAFVPFDLSNNRATLGDNAGALTWAASVECAKETQPPLLDTDEKKEAFRDFVESSGGWTREEINAWDDTELNALSLQWVAEWDWADYQERAERGSISGNLFRADDGQVYFSISN